MGFTLGFHGRDINTLIYLSIRHPTDRMPEEWAGNPFKICGEINDNIDDDDRW